MAELSKEQIETAINDVEQNPRDAAANEDTNDVRFTTTATNLDQLLLETTFGVLTARVQSLVDRFAALVEACVDAVTNRIVIRLGVRVQRQQAKAGSQYSRDHNA